MIPANWKGFQCKERKTGDNSILGEYLVSKWPLMWGWKREQRCKLLKHLPKEHGDTGEDAEFSLKPNHGLFRSFRSQD